MARNDDGRPGGLPMNGAGQAVSAVPVGIPDAGAWCRNCNVPAGVGACQPCRQLSWQGVMELQRPKSAPAPDMQMFTLSLSVGMGAAAEIVRRQWGDRVAQCILDYIKDFDAKVVNQLAKTPADERSPPSCGDATDNNENAQAIEARRAETQSGSVHESAVPSGCAQPSEPSS